MLASERVFNRLQGKSVDFVPFAPLASLYGARLTSCPLNKYYTDAYSYLKGQIAVASKIEPDILFTPFALVMEAEAFGSQAVFFEKNPPNLKKPAIVDFKAISKLNLPDIENHPGLVYLRESTRLMAKEFKQNIPVAAIVNSPTELPALIMGIENWIDTLLFHADEAKLLIELCTEHFVRFSNTLLHEGASCIVTPASFSNPTIITRNIAAEILIPQLKQAYSRVNGAIVFHHGGARLIPFLDLLHNLPNVVGFVISPKDSFDEVRQIIGNDTVVFGNINGQMLWKTNKDIIEKWCSLILENRKNDAKFILTTSNADIPFDTPLENIKIMKQTIKDFAI